MSDDTVFITVVIFIASPELLLNAHTCRYEAGAERGKNVFGLLPAEPNGRESGNPHAKAAVSAQQGGVGLRPASPASRSGPAPFGLSLTLCFSSVAWPQRVYRPQLLHSTFPELAVRGGHSSGSNTGAHRDESCWKLSLVTALSESGCVQVPLHLIAHPWDSCIISAHMVSAPSVSSSVK